MSYSNNHHEGWDLVWKDNFLYKKMLGGEYSKNVSLGEHLFLKENLFAVLPEIYTIFRKNARIKGVEDKFVRDVPCKHVTILFGDSVEKRRDLSPKKYLQNSFGVEEMKNDRMIGAFSKMEKSEIAGTLELFVTADLKLFEMRMDLSFLFSAENVKFTIKGKRELRSLADEEVIASPEFIPEYHRRTIEAAKNIMEETK